MIDDFFNDSVFLFLSNCMSLPLLPEVSVFDIFVLCDLES